MRKPIAMLGAAALLSAFPAAPALAEGATIIKDSGCFGVVPDENGQLTGAFVTGDYISRTSKSGNTTFTCHFDLTPDQAPATNTKASGFLCGTPSGSTTDTRINASPGGRMVMTCSIKAGSV